jgi:hypothetical protein
MPLGAEPLGNDGKQLFYGTEDGLGSVLPLGEMLDVTWDPNADLEGRPEP